MGVSTHKEFIGIGVCLQQTTATFHLQQATHGRYDKAQIKNKRISTSLLPCPPVKIGGENIEYLAGIFFSKPKKKILPF
jgi:hypothetical protein